MDDLNGKTNDKYVNKDFKNRYLTTLNTIGRLRIADYYDLINTSYTRDFDLERDSILSDLDIRVLSKYQRMPEDVYTLGEKMDGKIKDSIKCAAEMAEGKFDFDMKWLTQLFGKLNNNEIVELLEQDGMAQLSNNKYFIQTAMEQSGAVIELMSFASEDVVRQMLQDRELIEKICRCEISNKSELSVETVLTALLSQLNSCSELTENKEFMTEVLRNFGELCDGRANLAMMDILTNKCQALFKDRDFTETVFDYIEICIEASHSSYENFGEMKDLAEVMLKEPELAADEELAKRYVKDFLVLFNIDKSHLENKEFIKMIVSECDPLIYAYFDLPDEYYSDPEILTNYIRGKAEWNTNGIDFDFDNEVLTSTYKEVYGETMEETLLSCIKGKIKKYQSIVISEDISDRADEIVSTLEQWAQDNDLMRIGEKLEVFIFPQGEVAEGQLNIGTGIDHRNTINEDGFGYELTIVLDPDRVMDTFSRIGITSKDYTEDILRLSKKKGELQAKEQAAKALLGQYEELTVDGLNIPEEQ